MPKENGKPDRRSTTDRPPFRSACAALHSGTIGFRVAPASTGSGSALLRPSDSLRHFACPARRRACQDCPILFRFSLPAQSWHWPARSGSAPPHYLSFEWRSHPSRTPGVVDATAFASHERGKEELIAEFGAAFLCGSCGIAPKNLENSAAYIAYWIAAPPGQDLAGPSRQPRPTCRGFHLGSVTTQDTGGVRSETADSRRRESAGDFRLLPLTGTDRAMASW